MNYLLHLHNVRNLVYSCLIVFLASCGGGGGGSSDSDGDGDGDGTTVGGSTTYSIGGRLTGLDSSKSIILQNNGGDDLTLSADGEFSFATKLANNAAYDLSVETLPDGQVCTSTFGAGTVSGADVTDINLFCGPASSANTWKSLTGMGAGNGRFQHTATVLDDGRILVVAGLVRSVTERSDALLYDPDTGAWESAGILAFGRADHTATLLSSGKVLVVGGLGSSYLDSTELYDPAGGWSTLGIIGSPGARALHTATRLQNGDVLVVGGLNNISRLSTTSQYSTVGGWTAKSSLKTARDRHTATLLNSGKVLVTGGFNSSSLGLNNAEIYDPGDELWSSIPGPMTSVRYNHTATLLSDGRVLIAGGTTTGVDELASAEIYDPSTNSFTAVASMNEGRERHSAEILANGKVVVMGGNAASTSSPTSSAEIYDPVSDTWTIIDNIPLPARDHASVVMASGDVVVTGGIRFFSGIPVTLTGVSSLSTAEFNWFPVGDMQIPRTNHTATLLADGNVLAVGGQDDSSTDLFTTFYNSAEQFDTATETWPATLSSLDQALVGHSATLLEDGNVLVAGGAPDGATTQAAAYLYDGTTDSWTSTGDLMEPRMLHTAIQLRDGRVFVVGGRNGGSSFSSAEIYDPQSGSWSSAGESARSRLGAAATLLPGGKVLVTGGESGFATGLFTNSAELYDPDTNSWQDAANLTNPRRSHSAVLLPDGNVLVAGGRIQDGSLFGVITSDYEIYNPQTDTWTPGTNSMGIVRSGGEAVLLASGKVLIPGSGTGNSHLYDPVADSWSEVSGLSTGRSGYAVTRLDSGKVLISGGANSNALDNSELGW